MKAFTTFSILLLSSVVSFVHSGDGTAQHFHDPLYDFMQAQRLRKPVAAAVSIENSSKEEYSPVYVGIQDGLKETDKISSLPGQPTGVNFDHYSGYVTVDPIAGRALHYYFAESSDSSGTPLVLWLNGGPGCSSLGAGAMTSLGPFRVNSDGKTLWHNPFAWNNLANVIFLESPAGVGFSYSNTSSDYSVGDSRTALDTYTFLINWLERFPEFKTRDFYITGESYAGHYVPQLAQLILQNNNITNQTVINLKGIAIGNGYMDLETQNKGTIDYIWSHALISDEIHEAIIYICNFSSSDTCSGYIGEALQALGNINPYNIYYPLCNLSLITLPKADYDPCSGAYVDEYLNLPQVQHSLNVNITGSLPGPWSFCSNIISGNWTDRPDSVLDVIEELMSGGIRVWLYSGDTDAVVPVTTTRYAIEKKLGKSVKTPMFAWYYEGEVGGFVVEYNDMTFVTVRGAGHSGGARKFHRVHGPGIEHVVPPLAGHAVPSYQPGRALALFKSFLEGKLPPPN